MNTPTRAFLTIWSAESKDTARPECRRSEAALTTVCGEGVRCSSLVDWPVYPRLSALFSHQRTQCADRRDPLLQRVARIAGDIRRKARPPCALLARRVTERVLRRRRRLFCLFRLWRPCY